MAAFDAWAAYYDLIHKGLPGEAAFYVNGALSAGGSCLELGCGTGRVAVAMALAGAQVVGLDNSRAMLDVCVAKWDATSDAEGSLHLIEGDMRAFDLGRTFNLIAMPYRAFMHLQNPNDQRRCLTCVRTHLAPDGRFILNTWIPDFPQICGAGLGAGSEEYDFIEEYPIEERGNQAVILRHFGRVTYDHFDQRMIEEHLVEELDGKGNLIRSTTLPMVRVWTTVREMDNLLRLSGFETDAVYGGFHGEALGPSSRDAVWVLRRGG